MPESPLMCRMMCPEAEACPAGQCSMREETLFDVLPGLRAGWSPAAARQGGLLRARPAMLRTAGCELRQGEDCGGRVWTDCGTWPCHLRPAGGDDLQHDVQCRVPVPARNASASRPASVSSGGDIRWWRSAGSCPVGRFGHREVRPDSAQDSAWPRSRRVCGGASDWMVAL